MDDQPDNQQDDEVAELFTITAVPYDVQFPALPKAAPKSRSPKLLRAIPVARDSISVSPLATGVFGGAQNGFRVLPDAGDLCCVAFEVIETKKSYGVEYTATYDCFLGGDIIHKIQETCGLIIPWSGRVPPALLVLFSQTTIVTGFSSDINSVVIGYLGCVNARTRYVVTDSNFATSLPCRAVDPRLPKRLRAKLVSAQRRKDLRLLNQRNFVLDQQARATARKER